MQLFKLAGAVTNTSHCSARLFLLLSVTSRWLWTKTHYCGNAFAKYFLSISAIIVFQDGGTTWKPPS